MKIVSLDVHGESSEMVVVSESGEVLLKLKVATEREELRRMVGGIAGPKQVVFEEGPMSGMIRDALEGLAEEIISCDGSRNALIARAEDSDDERDAIRLAVLARAGALHGVYVAPERYRELRSLLGYDRYLAEAMTGVKNRIKALCRRHGIRCRGVGVYGGEGRAEVLKRVSGGMRWQMGSAYRQLAMLAAERLGVHRVLGRVSGGFGEVELLRTIPGVGPIAARTLVGWIVDPSRFKSRNALNGYAGLGIRQSVTNWEPVGRARASRRGQRAVKRVLMLSARAAIRGKNALARRYQSRREAGWEDRKAMRDVARTILFVACGMWKQKEAYRDERVRVPTGQGSGGES